MERALLGAALLCAGAAAAQDRPAEEDLFGKPTPDRATPAPEGGTTPPAAGTRVPGDDAGARQGQDRDRFGAPPPPGAAGAQGAQADRLLRQLGMTENPLSIGGQIYLRSTVSTTQGSPPSQWGFSVPTLVDTYLDVQPNDRVRGFVLGRMQYDPTIDPTARTIYGQAYGANPGVLLDQLWIRFDAFHTAFVTAGKQHVKWGTGRFWNPTDYLHTVRRDPLAVFDPRTGTTLVKVHVPWERYGWNFYGIAVLEPLTVSTQTGALDPNQATVRTTTPYGQIGGVGGALRAEVVLGPSELGLGAVYQRGHRPHYAADLSVGLWEIDLYGEAALKTGSEIPVYEQKPGATAETPILERYQLADTDHFTPAVVGGARWAHKYSDEDHFELGVEYFYNETGYGDETIYPWLLLNNAYTPFYLGRHYLGVYLQLPNPGSWNNTTFILSTIGNLSDRSFVSRFDHSVVLLTYLRLETFVQVHYGTKGGEFRLGLSVPAIDLGNGTVTPAVTVGTPQVDAGVALRVSL